MVADARNRLGDKTSPGHSPQCGRREGVRSDGLGNTRLDIMKLRSKKREVAKGKLMVVSTSGDEVDLGRPYFWVPSSTPYDDERAATQSPPSLAQDRGVTAGHRLRDSAFKRSLAKLPVARVDGAAKGDFCSPTTPRGMYSSLEESASPSSEQAPLHREENLPPPLTSLLDRDESRPRSSTAQGAGAHDPGLLVLTIPTTRLGR